jgi:hypothetical protein
MGEFLVANKDLIQIGVALLDVFVTVILAGIGWQLAKSISRDMELKRAERRLGAYASLWSITCVARPTRIVEGESNPLMESGPLSETERYQLHRAMTEWYYEDGNGMLLENGTREMYTEIKWNLICSPKEFKPDKIAKKLDDKSKDYARGRLLIHQLSLLRTRMNADLDIYHSTLHKHEYSYKPGDIEFLCHCHQTLEQKPWNLYQKGAVQLPVASSTLH